MKLYTRSVVRNLRFAPIASADVIVVGSVAGSDRRPTTRPASKRGRPSCLMCTSLCSGLRTALEPIFRFSFRGHQHGPCLRERSWCRRFVEALSGEVDWARSTSPGVSAEAIPAIPVGPSPWQEAGAPSTLPHRSPEEPGARTPTKWIRTDCRCLLIEPRSGQICWDTTGMTASGSERLPRRRRGRTQICHTQPSSWNGVILGG